MGKAGRLWFAVLTTTCHSRTTFAEFADETVAAAAGMFGAAQAAAVRDAWHRVGVLGA